MRYSLVSRFRGTILGVLLGEIITKSQDKLLSVERLHTTSLHGVRMAVVGAESLISLGRFDLDDWRSRQQECSHLDETLTVSPAAILATLPLGLFFHENTIKLRENLLLLVKMWENDPLVRDGTLALGFAIAQSLTEKLSSVTLLHQTISFIGETSTSLPEQLLKVNYLLNYQAGLEKAQAELITEEKLSSTIAMAFYCFLDTLEDFRLSVLRATQNDDTLQGVSAITGALSGAYNSTAGIPTTWQVLLQHAKSQESELTSFSQVLKLADALVAEWSGVYNGSYSTEVTDEKSWLSLQAIASPRVIR
ncbi:MAG: ADP-ribosylglycohydrolase family protein [Stigonema ocellatum SAG 48.90 = DSM 106950]|nr:ADP-ribosylglycohydrolase family protein [Stigonema ocellatum SAG 48.90 = DSM 106950]